MENKLLKIKKVEGKDFIYILDESDNILGKINKENFYPPKAITIVSVKDFIEEVNYCIPSFQRGYRWDTKQVKDLLEDINQISLDDKESNDQYSLQPIVLKKSNDDDYDYDVIDGQQRITTLFIILKAIGKDPKYTISYEARDDSKDFLYKLKSRYEGNPSNMDFYHMQKAYETAIEYFDKNNKTDWHKKLVNENVGAFFIRYEILENDKRDVEEIFNNLNAGKVRLTNSELIKANLLLNIDSNNRTNKELEISYEWDRIERKLQDNNFWGWLGMKEISGPRIEYVFKLKANLIKKEEKYTDKIDSYTVFTKDVNNIIDKWNKTKELFMLLEDWYEDEEIYHIVGFFNNAIKNTTQNDLFHIYNFLLENDSSDNKINFRSKVKDFLVNDSVKKSGKTINFSEYRYDKEGNNDDTYNILLLFNIIISINSSNNFNFANYHKTLKNNKRYDIEHIYPQADEDISSENLKVIIEKSANFLKELGIENQNFKEYNKKTYNKLIDINMGESDKKVNDLNDLGNLCLLDQSTNSSFKNFPFIIKLGRIIEETQKSNSYILPATKNVFLKYYSDYNKNNLIWTNSDAENYRNKMIETLKTFIEEED